MSPTPGVHLETIHTPASYTQAQLDYAAALAAALNRGKLVLIEPPEGKRS